MVLNFDFWSFEFVSYFDIRISDLPVSQKRSETDELVKYFILPF